MFLKFTNSQQTDEHLFNETFVVRWNQTFTAENGHSKVGKKYLKIIIFKQNWNMEESIVFILFNK